MTRTREENAADLAHEAAQDTWVRRYSQAAMAEGWDVFDSDGVEVQIQRLDDPADSDGEPIDPVFDGDHDAWEHVVRRAREGSEMHLRALAEVSQAERERIAEHCGPLPELLHNPV